MPYLPLPSPSILDAVPIFGVRGGKKVWRDETGQRYYTWDGLHGEVEVFNKRGRHLGAIDPLTGTRVKQPVKGRTLDV